MPIGLEIEKIEFLGYEDVYNMEVEKHHNFSINGGLIVHNCIDSTRYALEEDMLNRKVTVSSKSRLGL